MDVVEQGSEPTETPPTSWVVVDRATIAVLTIMTVRAIEQFALPEKTRETVAMAVANALSCLGATEADLQKCTGADEMQALLERLGNGA